MRMNNIFMAKAFAFSACLFLCACAHKTTRDNKGIVLHDLTLIDGNGGKPQAHQDIWIQGDSIVDIGNRIDTVGLQVINLSGKTVMPSLISAHVHIGTLKGTGNKASNYTRANILAQLKKYEDYGVGNILVMGSDRPLLFESGLRDSSLRGLLQGTRIHTAGYGFGVPHAGPPVQFAMDHVFRPSAVSQIPAELDSLKRLNPDVVKIWVDDFGGKYKKMDPAIYKSIIGGAHKRDLRVVAHVYYLSDARKLVANGIDIFGHSIRDSIIDDVLISQMKAKNTLYIPTLSLDEFAYIYTRKTEWMNDEFFKKALEPGVFDMISSEKYQQDLKNSPVYNKNVQAFKTALINLKKLYDAGIFIALGTDSGAMPIRVQGFSEHLELELLVQAGLTPLEAITIGTKNSAKALKIDSKFGTLEKGKMADLLILDNDPTSNIKNTRSIFAVYKSGKEVSKGPLKS